MSLTSKRTSYRESWILRRWPLSRIFRRNSRRIVNHVKLVAIPVQSFEYNRIPVGFFLQLRTLQKSDVWTRFSRRRWRRWSPTEPRKECLCDTLTCAALGGNSIGFLDRLNHGLNHRLTHPQPKSLIFRPSPIFRRSVRRGMPQIKVNPTKVRDQ